jgi:hypothetical protein
LPERAAQQPHTGQAITLPEVGTTKLFTQVIKQCGELVEQLGTAPAIIQANEATNPVPVHFIPRIQLLLVSNIVDVYTQFQLVLQLAQKLQHALLK